MTTRYTFSALDALASQWSDALSGLDSSNLALLSHALKGEATYGEVRMAVEERETGWRLGVSTDARANALSLVAGLLTSNCLDIRQADIFTVAPPLSRNAPSRRAQRRSISSDSRWRSRRSRRADHATRGAQRRIAMLFDLNERADRRPDWDKIEQDIRQVTGQALTGRTDSVMSTVIDQFAEAMRDAGQGDGGQLPMDISTDVDSSDRYTLITINSLDTPGFLFAFTNALASIHVNIVRATIRTFDDVVQDTFWLTDSSGGKIEAERRLNQLWVSAALIKQFTYYLPIAPDPAQALRQFNSLTSQLLSMCDWTSKMRTLESPNVMETLAKMMGMSRFLWEDFLRMQHDNLFPVLLDDDSLDESPTLEELEASIDSDLNSSSAHDTRTRILNDFKDREMFRVDLRYITGRSELRDFSHELTNVADALIRKAFEISFEFISNRYGTPRLDSGDACAWGVFALGKFGGREMGFGSDIEVTLVYESEGMATGRNPIRNSLFFEEVVKEFMKVLETRPHGIFEIDMRLRPYGSKGPLASSLPAFQSYYSPSGDARQFERLAMVRLRPVLSDDQFAHRVMRVQDAFVYSPNPLDFGEVLHLRRRQAAELVKSSAVNAKLSPGGLVDIEYYVQAWQIARGREESDLRLTNTMEAVDALCRKGLLDHALADGISEAYHLLRRLIDGLRIVRGNAKDLDIPRHDSEEFKRLAHRMAADGYEEDLGTRISKCMEFAGRLWEDHPPPT